MGANFSVTCDPDRDLVRIRLGGFFTPADVAAFLADRNAAHARLRCGPNRHVTIADVREMKILPQDAVTAFQGVLANPLHRSRRLAFVVAPSLIRSQVARALTGRNARFFENIAPAEDWLFSTEADEPSAPLRATG